MVFNHGSHMSSKSPTTIVCAYHTCVKSTTYESQAYMQTTSAMTIVAEKSLALVLVLFGEASPTFGHANVNFSVFKDRIRIELISKEMSNDV